MTTDGWHRTPGVVNKPLLTAAGIIWIKPTAGGIEAGQAIPLKTPSQRLGLGWGSPFLATEIPELL